MSDAQSWKSSAVALGSCIVTSQVLDVLYGLARGEFGALGHMALVLSLSLLVAAVVVLAVGRYGTRPTLAIWVLLEVVALVSSPPPIQAMQWSVLAAVAGVGGVWVLHRVAASARPAWLGVCVGSSIFLGFVFVPEVANLHARESHVVVRALWSASASFLAAIAALGVLLRTSRPRLAPFAGLLACGLVVAWSQVDELTAAQERRFASPPTAKGPNILVLVLDTVRADHLSLYGYERDTTPRLAERMSFEQGAMVYPQAYSTASWTRPAHASLFTGLLPSEHGCREDTCGSVQADGAISGVSVISLGDTLAGRLSASGYRTAGVIANYFLMALSGVGEGFDRWMAARYSMSLHGVGEFVRCLLMPHVYASQRSQLPTAPAVNRDVLGLLGQCPDGGCFIVANYIEAHDPYFASHPYAGTFLQGAAPMRPSPNHPAEVQQRIAAAYDEEILELDAHVGDLIDELEHRGLLDDMWLFVLSDHGESFGEHDSSRHGSNAYNEQVRIPLAVRPPRGMVLPTPLSPVGLLDVTATISAIGTGSPMGHGRDLRDGDATSLVQIEFFGWPEKPETFGAYSSLPARAVVQGWQKLLEIDGRPEFYDLAADPKELRNRVSGFPEAVEQLTPMLPPLDRNVRSVRPSEEEMDPETLEALRALGYVQ